MARLPRSPARVSAALGATLSFAGLSFTALSFTALSFAGLSFAALAGSSVRHAAAQSAVGAGDYFPITPVRILDTRSGIGGHRTLGPGQSIDVVVTGSGSVPSTGATAVVLNATVTNTTEPGYLTLFPADTALPDASNLNWIAGQTVPNLATVKIGAGGRLRVFNANGNTDVLLDVSGWYSDGTIAGGNRLDPVPPGRVYDSRDTNDPIPAGQAKVLRFVPPTTGGAEALVFNVTVTEADRDGFLTLGPGDPGEGAVVPNASNLNFRARQTVANAVIARKDANGAIFAFSEARTHVIFDQVARFIANPGGESAGRFTPVEPARILDTRSGIGRTRGPVGANATIPLTVTGVGGVPGSGVGAVLVNLTVTEPASDGWLAMWPNGQSQPDVSSINFSGGQTVANLVLVPVGTGGQVLLHNRSQGAHTIVDVVGWYRA